MLSSLSSKTIINYSTVFQTMVDNFFVQEISSNLASCLGWTKAEI